MLPAPTQKPSPAPRPRSVHADCRWQAEAQAWIDENGNGRWDPGELPLRNVAFRVDDILTNNDPDMVYAISDSSGQAQLDAWLPGCPQVQFEVYAEALANYEATTPERVADTGQELFQFGYRYRPGAPPPTPTPVASLACTAYEVARGDRTSGYYQMDIEVAPNGDVWVATGEGVRRFSGPERTQTVYTTHDGLPDHSVQTLTIGLDGTVWVGTDRGAARFDGQAWTTYTEADGLADDAVNDIVIDSAGTVWFGTNRGISTFAPGANAWHTEAIEPAVTGGWPIDMPIKAAPDGSLWFFPYDQVYRLEPARLPGDSPAGAGDLRLVERFPAMINILVATGGDDLFWVFGWGEKGPTLVRFDPVSSHAVVYDHAITGGAMFGGRLTNLAVAPDGSVWLTFIEEDVAAVHMFPGGDDPAAATWIDYGPTNGLALGALWSVAVEPGGAVWFSTGDGLVVRCTENRTPAAASQPADMPEAASLKGTTMPDGTLHE